MYDGLTENEAVPQEYLDTNIPIAESRIDIGGHRLAHVLSYCFGTSVNAEDERSASAVANFL